MNKDSFLLYVNHRKFFEQLTLKQAGMLINGIFEYVEDGKVPKLDAVSKMAFISIKQNLDINAEKYKETVERRRIAGSKGGKQRAANLKNEANATFASKNVANQADNDNVNVNVLSL